MSSVNLTTLTRVKAVLRPTGDLSTDIDKQLNKLISIASGRAEQVCGREFKKAARTEYFDVECGQGLFVVRHPPIDWAVPLVVKNAFDQDFVAASAIDNDDIVKYYDKTGRVAFRIDLEAGVQALEIAYTGGIGADTAAIESADETLADLIALEVTHLFQRMPTLGVASKGTIGVEYESFRKVEMLEPVRDYLESKYNHYAI